jgi:alpha-beta hydrolase superfamily lysophospholipase
MGTQESILVIHGMNLKPSKMDSLEQVCRGAGFRPVRVQLSGHGEHETLKDYAQVTADLWEKEVIDAIAANQPVKGAIAFSLGGLCYLNAVANLVAQGEKEPQFHCLFAPAIGLRPFTSLLKPLLWLDGLVVPSASHFRYRRHWGTPMPAYRALFKLIERLQMAADSGSQLRNRSMMLMNQNDELVHPRKVEALLGQISKKCHETVIVDTRQSKLRPKYNHLILDEECLGQSEYSKICRILTEFMVQ